jgi:hypothetical protein
LSCTRERRTHRDDNYGLKILVKRKTKNKFSDHLFFQFVSLYYRKMRLHNEEEWLVSLLTVQEITTIPQSRK